MITNWNFAICDDEKIYREALYDNLICYAKEKGNYINITQYSAADKLVEDIRQNPEIYHMVFLDVEMPETTGVEAAKEVRKEIGRAHV